jgi:hypothetical protein
MEGQYTFFGILAELKSIIHRIPKNENKQGRDDVHASPTKASYNLLSDHGEHHA